jgi:hypothetical protein
MYREREAVRDIYTEREGEREMQTNRRDTFTALVSARVLTRALSPIWEFRVPVWGLELRI